ncbi:hypothetical protein BDF19DRAFT_430361 [Syncephalis fuscata]|nr:hypothetical protein BDF19DRAFT_430361 [Syncephalis fuscata]
MKMTDKDTVLCTCCQQVTAKYRCPRCDARTCSLVCVNTHKETSGCSGKRDRTQYVSMKTFDVNQLASDIGFLEEVERERDMAERGLEESVKHQQQKELMNRSRRQRTPLTRSERIAKWAYERCQVKVRCLPTGMKRQQENKTSWDGRQKYMLWTVQVEFGITSFDKATTPSTQQLLLHRISDTMLLRDIIQSAREKIGGKCTTPTNDMERILLRQVDTPANAPGYIELPSSIPLYKALTAQVLIEYPTLYVVSANEAATMSREWTIKPYAFDDSINVSQNKETKCDKKNREQLSLTGTAADVTICAASTVSSIDASSGDGCKNSNTARAFEVMEPESDDSNDTANEGTTVKRKPDFSMANSYHSVNEEGERSEASDGMAATTALTSHLASLVDYTDSENESDDQHGDGEVQLPVIKRPKLSSLHHHP